MADTYDSVLDRIGAFNAATESMSKGRAREVVVEVAGRDDARLRLAHNEDGYAIEVHGAPAGAAALEGMDFARQGDMYVRQVRKSERSWNVASQLEDVLQEGLGLGPDVSITVQTT